MRRAFVVLTGMSFATAVIAACSLRDTAYLQAGGGTSNEGGSETSTPGDGSTATCTPTTVASGQLGPRLLTQDAESLYWATGEGNIVAIRKDGSESPRTVVATGGVILALATADSAPLFYTKDSSIFSVPKTGGDGTPIGSTNPPARALAVDSTFVFAMAEDEDSTETPTLQRFAHTGGAPTILRVADGAFAIYAMALQGNDVFWDEGGGTFFSLPKTAAADAAPSEYKAGGSEEGAFYAGAFAVDETAFFYSDGQDVRTHERLPSSTPTTVIPYADEADAVTAIAIDDRFVYAVETAANGTLRRNTKDAKGEPELLLEKLTKPNAVVVDANAVYVSVEGPPGAIIKCVK